MAAIVSVTDGVDDILATHINQYAQTMNNVFGITDTAQANLGKLPLPWSTSDPAPANGLLWMRSNLGTAGRMRKRINGYSVDHMGVRQRLEAIQNPIYNSSVPNSSASDIAGCVLNNFNSTGGRLRIRLTGQNGVPAQFYAQINSSSASTWSYSLLVLVNGVQVVLGGDFMIIQGPTTILQRNITCDFSADYLPPAPLVNVTIKAQVYPAMQPSSGAITTNGFRLIVEELDD